MEKISTLTKVDLSAEFGVVILLIALALTLAPYFAGADFGVLRVPEFSPKANVRLIFMGPICLLVIGFSFVPIWPTDSQAPIEGHWLLRLQDEPPNLPSVAWMNLKLHGTRLEALGDGWTGEGSFDGEKGYYDWKFQDGRSGTTTIHFDGTDILFGEVHGSGIDWTYWGTRKKK